jgi:aspartyl-tRNA(Asn)/glutamyl-tRNA(Gln) amidotransferase subunit A
MERLGLVEWRDALRARRISATELAQAALAAARRLQPVLNALVSETEEGPLLAAVAAAQAAVDAGGAAPLAGIPFAHKDLFCTRGLRTTAGSRMLERFVPPYDATVAARLAAAGATCIGKANMDEFAMGSSNENSHFGPVRNPWDPARVPGGSSGGSAALVAAGVVPFATGSDTGGSVRQPAAFCGITGLKPTYGRVSRHGMIAYASSLDQAGVLARSAEDCAHVLAAIAGADPNDATCADVPVDDYVATLARGVAGRRIGVVRELFGAGVADAVATRSHDALAALERAGATLVDVSLPSVALAIPAYYVIAPAEASSNLARYDGVRYGLRASAPSDLDDLYSRTRAAGFGRETRLRILSGTYVLSSGYYDAYYRRSRCGA